MGEGMQLGHLVLTSDGIRKRGVLRWLFNEAISHDLYLHAMKWKGSAINWTTQLFSQCPPTSLNNSEKIPLTYAFNV